ncbi:MAG: hypothetical protein MAG551_02392 [Candidatus Scalindua arabica]|uniref:Uncharacterized protein n=1 Tax=Candidatus Scalindua arabica TaxID=1127984 RepID=A0A942A6X2_9BACT|nr:hypothetical protein [Candidatus Scalindua arabica]
MKQRKQQKFAVCILNEYCGDLELRKVYKILPDKSAANDGYLRVIDETGEDYIYPKDNFIMIELPKEAEHALSK